MSDIATSETRTVSPATVWRWVLTAGYVLILGLNLPGHLSVDSVIALSEGHTGVRTSWGPPMYSAIVGLFDHLSAGTGLFVACSVLLLLSSWASLPALRRRIIWAAPLVLAAAFALPQVLIYQGIVWKDVLFANLLVAGFVALARAALRWRTRSAVVWLGFAWLCLALGCLVRQNGAIGVVFAAIALGWMVSRGRWRTGLIWGAAGFIVPLVLAMLLNAVTPVRDPPGTAPQDKGVRLVQQYDLVGALADDPRRTMAVFQAVDPAALQVLRQEAPKVYSPVRIDVLDESEVMGAALRVYDAHQISAQWRRMILSDPVGYAKRRLIVFDWVFLTPKLNLCLPIHLGVGGPPQLETRMQLVHGFLPRDFGLYDYASLWFASPLYSHLAYALIALAVAGWLLVRREGADIAIAGLMFAGLGFAGSFAIISLACDYRYLYALDLTGITGLLYVAVDPRRRSVARADTA